MRNAAMCKCVSVPAPGLMRRMAALNAVRAASTTSAARPVMGLSPAPTSTVVACVAMKPSMWQPRSLWWRRRSRAQQRQQGKDSWSVSGHEPGCCPCKLCYTLSTCSLLLLWLLLLLAGTAGASACWHCC